MAACKSKLSASKKTQNEETKQKLTLTRDEQSHLLTKALEANTPLAAALLVLFQAGGMAAEIARLRVEEDLWLNHEFPFVAFLGGWNRDTKNEERPRYIPIHSYLVVARGAYGQIQFLEPTDGGNWILTTVVTQAGTNDWPSVHSRHIWMFDSFVTSQNFGTCTVR